MEGEVRHALESNPEMDIVMLHFIYDPFIPMIARRQMPDVILNHERVANHYLIPSINLCQEIGERMQNGELPGTSSAALIRNLSAISFMLPLSAIFSTRCGKEFRRKGQLRHTTFRPSRWMPTVIITETSSLSKSPLEQRLEISRQLASRQQGPASGTALSMFLC